MKPVKLFDDYLEMAAASQNLTREEYAARYLSEAYNINKFSPLSYAEKVANKIMTLADAAKEADMPQTQLLKLVKRFDKNFKMTFEAQDHEVAMAQSSLQNICDAALELQEKVGEMERDLPGWIQNHITSAENYITQANDGFHELHESEVNEKMKIIMRNILLKMVPAAFGASSNVKMREEIKDAIAAAIEPILTKYDYVVESKESDALAKEIDKAMIKIDDSMSYKDFADAVATILRDEYGKHNYMRFIEELKNKL